MDMTLFVVLIVVALESSSCFCCFCKFMRALAGAEALLLLLET